MQKLGLILSSMLALGISAAHADSVRLNDIDTNDCLRAQREVSLLTGPGVRVNAVCSPYGSYPSNNGHVYDYRVYTTLEVASPILQGVPIRVGDIDTNDCVWAQSEISLLNLPNVRVEAECSPYMWHGYPSENGEWYNYRLYTTVTVY